MTSGTTRLRAVAPLLGTLLIVTGCGSSRFTTDSQDYKQVQQAIAARKVNGADVTASLDAFSLRRGFAAVASSATAAAGLAPLIAAHFAVPAALTAPGAPAATSASTTVKVAGGQTVVTSAVILGNAGTDTVTTTFTGAVSQAADPAAALAELADADRFALLTIAHKIALTGPEGPRVATEQCAYGTAMTCSQTLQGMGLTLSLDTALTNKGLASGTGSVRAASDTRPRTLLYVRNGDGSGTESVLDPISVTARLVTNTAGAISGTVSAGGMDLRIISGAAGELTTSDGLATSRF